MIYQQGGYMINRLLVVFGIVLVLCCTGKWALSAQQPLSPSGYNAGVANQPSAKDPNTIRLKTKGVADAVATDMEKQQLMNAELYGLFDSKEPAVYAGATAPADTTKLFRDSNEETGVLIQKKYVTGTGWVRVGSRGVQYASSCAGIATGMCIDSAGKLYYHNGTAVVEVGTGSGGGIDHATSDGNYYASRNGAWASLAGVREHLFLSAG